MYGSGPRQSAESRHLDDSVTCETTDVRPGMALYGVWGM